MADHLIPLEERQHYTTQFLHFVDDDLNRFEQGDAINVLQKALSFFGSELPAPPHGLPGANGSPTQEVMHALDLAHSYFLAIVTMQPRRQWNAYKEMAALFQRQYQAGVQAERDDQMERSIARAEADAAERERTAALISDADAALVYFIASDDGPIKIGMSDDPRKRLRALQTSHHQPLTILAIRDGGRAREAEYHRRFADMRLTGEWFERHPDILAEIARLAPEAA